MDSQPIRAIPVLLATLAISSCNNLAERTQPAEAIASRTASSTRQWLIGDTPIPTGHIHVTPSNYRNAGAFRSVSLTGTTAKGTYGHSKNVMPYHLSELPNPVPDEFVSPNSEGNPTLSFLRRALLRFFDSRRVEQ